MELKERLKLAANSGKATYQRLSFYISAIKFIYGFIEVIKLLMSLVI